MDVYDNMVGTLRSQMDGHPPLVLGSQQGGAEICENLCPAITAAAGTSGNNQPVVMASAQSNAEIYRNLCPALSSGLGTQPVLYNPAHEEAVNRQSLELSRVFSFKNIHEYAEYGFASTQTARQHKAATDLVCEPMVFENHGIDSRYTGPHDVAPTVTSRYGTGGNNVPLTIDSPAQETYAIAGNIIDRQPQNGGNGFGYQRDISYTITATDRHCVYTQQRSDAYAENDIASTQTARQHKDATDLVCEVAGLDCFSATENGDLCSTLQVGTSLNKVHPVRIGSLVRRLTPLECERLMGFPDNWTSISGASDSKQYQACGNSVAIPCVEYIMMGIAAVFAEERA